ncbi:hypothetical protein [Acidithiobacillus ferrivorans]|uniref:Uncharacterized protein n=1 Tax=Acidithiobacillus ferrivorans TaxID=160808 RepID=A0A7T5BGY6_9PROT|nr:hypothetical protein [Acidithiobacillus ferrivorans]QQD72819.1 hypothetical protein H2515_00235 [Acidithiobacillus ferrivorans]
MDDETEELQIVCPLCSEEHSYRLAVDRSYVLYHMTSAMMDSKPTYKRFKRIFTCPAKNEHFQAVVRLEESFGTIINDVKVVPDDIA